MEGETTPKKKTREAANEFPQRASEATTKNLATMNDESTRAYGMFSDR